MIAVYAIGQVKVGKETEFKALAQKFIQESRTHKGCVSYDCGEVSNAPNKFCFVERWESKADLDAHLATEFFQANVPALVETLENGLLDINVVELL